MPKIILIATSNQGKLKEYQKLLTNLKVVSLNQLKNNSKDFKVAETGQSFKANAILKAKAFGQLSNLLTLADDSGLVVDYLGGKPGIYSARFAQGNYKLANQKIIQQLKNQPKNKRTARFKTSLALYNPQDKSIKTFSGVTHGWISEKPTGNSGFGYDPIFLSQDLGITFGEALDKQKNKVSHRARALKKLVNYLSKL